MEVREGVGQKMLQFVTRMSTCWGVTPATGFRTGAAQGLALGPEARDRFLAKAHQCLSGVSYVRKRKRGGRRGDTRALLEQEVVMVYKAGALLLESIRRSAGGGGGLQLLGSMQRRAGEDACQCRSTVQDQMLFVQLQWEQTAPMAATSRMIGNQRHLIFSISTGCRGIGHKQQCRWIREVTAHDDFAVHIRYCASTRYHSVAAHVILMMDYK
jgi:hypothetical protein